MQRNQTLQSFRKNSLKNLFHIHYTNVNFNACIWGGKMKNHEFQHAEFHTKHILILSATNHALRWCQLTKSSFISLTAETQSTAISGINVVSGVNEEIHGISCLI